jgi:hypothetical protein
MQISAKIFSLAALLIAALPAMAAPLADPIAKPGELCGTGECFHVLKVYAMEFNAD